MKSKFDISHGASHKITLMKQKVFYREIMFRQSCQNKFENLPIDLAVKFSGPPICGDGCKLFDL